MTAQSSARRGSPLSTADGADQENPVRIILSKRGCRLTCSCQSSPCLKSSLSASVLDKRQQMKCLSISDPDLPASTPISTYARRRTPQPSPVVGTFPREKTDDLDSPLCVPLTPPTLPSLLSVSFASLATSDMASSLFSTRSLSDAPDEEAPTLSRRLYRRTGVRVSSTRLVLGENGANRITPVA